MSEDGKFPVFNPAKGFCPICGAPVTVVLNPTEPARKIDCKSCGRISTFTVEIDWDWEHAGKNNESQTEYSSYIKGILELPEISDETRERFIKLMNESNEIPVINKDLKVGE